MKKSAGQLIPDLERVTKSGTLCIAISEGPFQRELGRLNDAHGQLMIDSSANLTGQGQKFRVEDIERAVIVAADLVVDYGRQKWHISGRAGTLIDLDNERVVRIGACYENIREKLVAWFGWTLPEDPDYRPEKRSSVGVSIKVQSD